MKRKYYSLDAIMKTGAHWKILYGMRSNGKSFSVKKYILEDAYKNKKSFVYLRRWGDDIKEKDVASYFADMSVKEITKGDYETVSAFRGYFYFANEDPETMKIERGPAIGRYCALNLYERYKSQVFKNIGSIVYEEFLTNKIYLGGSGENSEPRLLMHFVSTVARDENINVFLIGNTISRVCPYFTEWGLKGVMKQKPGTIDIYHLRGENGVVDIAVENCEVVNTNSKMFFGLASKQITSGEWEVDDVPKLLKPYKYYEMLYEISIVFNEFRYVLQLMFDNETGGTFVYIYPNTKARHIRRVITDVFNVDPFVTNGLMGKIRAECLIAECFRKGKVCFSDNLTGTDFKNVLNSYDLKGVIM